MQTIAQTSIHDHPQFATVLAEVLDRAVVYYKDRDVSVECLAKAAALARDGAVDVLNRHEANVIGEHDTYHCNGTCSCPAGMFGETCSHLIASQIMRSVAKRLVALDAAPAAPPLDITGAAALSPPLPLSDDEPVHISIPVRFVKMVHGQQFVLYAGLLAMAHDAGLVSLRASFVSVNDTMAIAEATATFQDGRVFTEAADATPGNVAFAVRPHFARVALTRAKARSLRDALNIGMCALEELGDE